MDKLIETAIASWLSSPPDDRYRAGLLQPGYIYAGATAATRDRLIAATEDVEDADLHLKALAWLGDDVVAETLLRWEARPPKWRARLYCGPSGYAHEAG